MNVAGLTIIKNANRFAYPIAECIEQHKDMFYKHFIGVPKKEQDTDGTIDLIWETCHKLGMTAYNYNGHIPDIMLAPSHMQNFKGTEGAVDCSICGKGGCNKAIYIKAHVILFELDWPNDDVAWSEESQDRALQQQMLDGIDFETCFNMHDSKIGGTKKEGFDWIVKIDADEAYNEAAIEELLEMMEILKDDSSISAISHNYLQFMGGLGFTVYDPTDDLTHIFKPGKAKFVGNDAMRFFPTVGGTAHIDDVNLLHFGYIKDPNLITTRIREHLVLNESMYPDAVHNASKWEDYKFEWPRHRVGAKLWPIAISDQPNETEYTPYPYEDLPSVLKEKVDEWNFYTPEI